MLARSCPERWIGWYISSIPATWEEDIEGLRSDASPKQKDETLPLKETENKKLEK
jgi:hypothetical protein